MAMYGTILAFIKFNNFGTLHLNGPGIYFIHSTALPSTSCNYKLHINMKPFKENKEHKGTSKIYHIP